MFHYVAGTADWFAAGLPREGSEAASRRAGDRARRDVPTCGLAERVGDVRERVRAAGWDACIVANEQRVVLGLLGEPALGADPETTVEQVMEPGPSTFRVNVPLRETADRMREQALDRAWITTCDGKLVGMLRRDDAEREPERD